MEHRQQQLAMVRPPAPTPVQQETHDPQLEEQEGCFQIPDVAIDGYKFLLNRCTGESW